ncbi:MAG: CoA transferase [Acidimicrobiales bacterium]
MNRALDGVRVIDLADRSAALAGRILADLGAEVILVEPPGGAPIRRLAPFLADEPGLERSCHHLYLNANKRSVVLDPALEPDRFAALVAGADVVIDSAPRSTRAAAGLDRLHRYRPGLIQCSVTPFGLAGPDGAAPPWADWRATDLIAGAAGGLVWVSGEPRGVPVHGAAYPSYTLAGLTAASAISIALHAVARGSEPSDVHIDLSLQEATVMAVLQTNTPGQWTWRGELPRRPGLSTALRCADGGYVGIMVRPDRFPEFLAWADAVGIDHGLGVDDWALARLDAPRRDNPVPETVRALAARLSRDEFAAGALRADQVCLPVLGFDDLDRTEQFVINDQFLTVADPALGVDLGFVRSPVDGMAGGVAIEPAPTLGQHQDLVDRLDCPPPAAGPGGAGGTAAPGSPSRVRPGDALAGVRVVDFGWVLAGPIGTRLLASFGAEVIRVESAARPDSMRSQAGPDGRPDPDLGGLFNVVNAGKCSFAVDLSTERGLALVKDLIATADVVVNNFRPDAMERMGLGFEVLRAQRADIVSLNLPGAHRRGPWAQRSSMGNILMAASGFNLLCGFDGERPRGVGVPYPDFTAPHLLVSAVLAALRLRDRTGRGQEIHLTQLSGMVSLLGVEWLHYRSTGRRPPRANNHDANHCPHGVFPAAGSERSDDEWIAVSVTGDDQWRALCAVMDRPDLADDDRFAGHAARKANEDALDAELAAWTATKDKWLLAQRLQAIGVPAAPVEHLADTVERDPQLTHHYQVVHQPAAPDVAIPIDGEAAHWLDADGGWIPHQLSRAPGTGEHNEWVVTEALGRSGEEYVDLVLAGVLG